MFAGNELGEYKDFIFEANLNFFHNGSLKFLHVTKQSEGHYMCEAKNEIGSGVSKVIFLKVNSEYYVLLVCVFMRPSGRPQNFFFKFPTKNFCRIALYAL